MRVHVLSTVAPVATVQMITQKKKEEKKREERGNQSKPNKQLLSTSFDSLYMTQHAYTICKYTRYFIHF